MLKATLHRSNFTLARHLEAVPSALELPRVAAPTPQPPCWAWASTAAPPTCRHAPTTLPTARAATRTSGATPSPHTASKTCGQSTRRSHAWARPVRPFPLAKRRATTASSRESATWLVRAHTPRATPPSLVLRAHSAPLAVVLTRARACGTGTHGGDTEFNRTDTFLQPVPLGLHVGAKPRHSEASAEFPIEVNKYTTMKASRPPAPAAHPAPQPDARASPRRRSRRTARSRRSSFRATLTT